MRLARTLSVAMIAVAAAGAAATAATPDGRAAFDYRRAGDTVVVSFSETDGAGGRLTLALYGNGRAVVRRPGSASEPHERTFQLTDDEVYAVVSALVDDGIPFLDADGARTAKRAALEVRRTARAAHALPIATPPAGDVTTTIEIHLERYQAAHARTFTRVDRRVTWTGLDADARAFPEIPAIQTLAAVRKELLALTERHDARTE